jgi:phytoene synthase
MPDPSDSTAALQMWRSRALHSNDHSHDPIPTAWRDACATYHIPQLYAEQLIDGVARDVVQNRYQTFAELAEYAYGVASTVGLMSMHIIGYTSEEAIPYAVRLGVALQMTNILRDVAEDWRRGRLYLPQEELAAFGLSEADIAAGIVTEKWRSFMRFQIERNRRLYREAWPGIALLNPEGRLAIAAAADFYAAILHDIEQHDYDVFTRRAHVGKWGKLRRIPSLWWQTRQRPGGQHENYCDRQRISAGWPPPTAWPPRGTTCSWWRSGTSWAAAPTSTTSTASSSTAAPR